jgi:prevent-host-death family protein
METTAREFNQKSSQILAAAARGETVTVTKNGTPESTVVVRSAGDTMGTTPQRVVPMRSRSRGTAPSRGKAPSRANEVACWQGQRSVTVSDLNSAGSRGACPRRLRRVEERCGWTLSRSALRGCPWSSRRPWLRTAAPTPVPADPATASAYRPGIQPGGLVVLGQHVRPVPCQRRRSAVRTRCPRRPDRDALMALRPQRHRNRPQSRHRPTSTAQELTGPGVSTPPTSPTESWHRRPNTSRPRHRCPRSAHLVAT